MKARNRAKHTGRRESGTFTRLPHAVMDSENFHALSGAAVKVLLILARQLNGRNNGDLCATFSIARKGGIASQETLFHALRELEHYGLIELTRRGGRHAPSLYAVTWLGIDECKGKLEEPSSPIPSGLWKTRRDPYIRRQKITKPATDSVEHRYGMRSDDSEKVA